MNARLRAYASPIITEVHPHPQDGPEWVELYNPEEETIDLSGWTMYDQLSSPSTIFSFTQEILPPNTYQVFELSSMKLNNTADGVVLKNPAGEQISAMQYESSSIGKSWSRKHLSSNAFVETSPTPGAPNPSPTPIPSTTPTPSPSTSPAPSPTPSPSPSPTPNATDPTEYNISITEIHPCPLNDEPEYVVIKNNTNSPIQLTNWKVRDAQNNLRSLSDSLNPQKSKKISWQHAILNNSGDEVFIETNSGAVVATESYNSCNKGESIFPQHNSSSATNQTNTDKNTATTAQNKSPNQNSQNILSASTSAEVTTSAQISYPLPNFSAQTKTATNSASTTNPKQTGQAIYTTPPTALPSPTPFLNVILGGLSVSASGVLLWYEKRIYKLTASMA